ncbi:MAG: hypothetical protein NTW44_01055 [Nitrospirae bacterium]|nr:hypothetical protein [Nitrospirota bacterium]
MLERLSGQAAVRISQRKIRTETHKDLAAQATESGVGLNRLASAKLSR